MMDEELIKSAKEYLTDNFLSNPSYSFGDGTIMIEHSMHVCEIAENLCVHQECDLLLVLIGALFHDIGKALLIEGKPVDWKILRERHKELNFECALPFLNENKLSVEFIEKFKLLFDHTSNLTEKSLINDADIVEFYMNYKLQKAVNDWAELENIVGELQRKADKFNTVLSCEWSKRFALPYWVTMIERWSLEVR